MRIYGSQEGDSTNRSSGERENIKREHRENRKWDGLTGGIREFGRRRKRSRKNEGVEKRTAGGRN